MKEFIREKWLIGEQKINKLHSAHIAVFGIGGVGGFVCESLARCGVGKIDLYDFDIVSISNINRQIIALHSTVGQSKVEAMKNRILDINPNCEVCCFCKNISCENIDDINLKVDYIVDAIDTISSKILLIEKANIYSVPIISCMGTGNKLDCTKLQITDIYKTSVCPLAKVMRKKLKAKGIKKLNVLYSTEVPTKPIYDDPKEYEKRKQTPASIAFVPSVAGIMIAQKVVMDILEK